MTPKEKAEQLVSKMFTWQVPSAIEYTKDGGLERAKHSALIAVDEIIKETKLHDLTTYQHGRTGFWQAVKQEIEKL